MAGPETLLDVAASPDGTSPLTIAFADNAALSAVVGEADAHLALIEQRLDVRLTPRGNVVAIAGGEGAAEHARDVLQELYMRATQGHEIGLGEVDGAIRMSAHTEELPLADIDEGETQPISARETQSAGERQTQPAGVRQTQPAGARRGMLRREIRTRKKTITARTPMQSEYMGLLEKHELVLATGPAGTGKTYLAVLYGVSLLEKGLIDRIILSRPAVEAGEKLGFLPGDMKEKVDPYLRPLYDALGDTMQPDKIEKAIAGGIIEVAPLAFMRGRTLANAFVILDEAQNTTSMQMKMFLTRLGENSRMVVNGDESQIDLPRGTVSGLVEAMQVLRGVPGIGHARFTAEDVVRHELVGRIVAAYDRVGAVRARARHDDGRPRDAGLVSAGAPGD
ncbi:MAG: PhoH family protein [Pseudomonadota bacterium]